MNKQAMVLQGMRENIHFSKTLKSQQPELFIQIMNEYPGVQIKERIWNFCFNNKSIPVCYCGRQVKFGQSFMKGYSRFCSTKCAQNNAEVRAACRATTLKTLGVEHNFASKDVIEKKKKTWLEKYGVDNPAKNPNINQKGMSTKEQRYGSEWVKKSFTRHMQEKYGVDNWVQVPELYQAFSEKNSNKKFVFPSGQEIHVQGYEPWALDILLRNFNETEIRVHRGVPTISYEMGGKILMHYPDIFISSENLIIEVKSDYTFKSLEKKNLTKAYSAITLGFKYQFWIFDRAGNLTVKEVRPI